MLPRLRHRMSSRSKNVSDGSAWASSFASRDVLRRAIFVGIAIVAIVASEARAQSAANGPEGGRAFWSPMGLPRLQTKAKPGKATPLPATNYEVDALLVPPNAKAVAGVRAIERGPTRLLELESMHEWMRPLQKAGNAPVCVSFLLYASDATVVAVDGAWLGVAASPLGGDLQLMIGEPVAGALTWREAGIHIPPQVFGGANMVALPVLTIRLDPRAGVWDLYRGSTQVADSLPLSKTTGSDPNHGNFLVRAGKGRVWLCGLVQTEDNPLFDDANGNGIDDEFERTKQGALLPSNLTATQRAAVAKEWREAVATQMYEAWLIEKPRPD